MRRLVSTAIVAAMLVLGSGAARGMDSVTDEYSDNFTHPLQLAYYVAHPIGYAAEWLIGRPLHYVFSRPYLDNFFGYKHYDEESAYFED